MFNQVFIERAYKCLDDVDPDGVHLIVDAGANIGCSAIYFLTRFPNATVIAIEPDVSNFAALSVNLAPYDGRVKLLNTGLWSHRCGLVMDEVPFGDGAEWSRRVRECRDGESALFNAVGINEVLAIGPYSRIDILKIDIEGAEKQVFGETHRHWLRQIENIVIELHGPDSEAVFNKAVAPEHFATSCSGELTVCKRRRRC